VKIRRNLKKGYTVLECVVAGSGANPKSNRKLWSSSAYWVR